MNHKGTYAAGVAAFLLHSHLTPTAAQSLLGDCPGRTVVRPVAVGSVAETPLSWFVVSSSGTRGVVEFALEDLPPWTTVYLELFPDYFTQDPASGFRLYARPGDGQITADYPAGDCEGGPIYDSTRDYYGCLITYSVPAIIDVTHIIEEAVSSEDPYVSFCMTGGGVCGSPNQQIRVLGPDQGEDPFDNFALVFVEPRCADTEPPSLVHGGGQPGETQPCTGYIDPRLENIPVGEVDTPRGPSEVILVFNEPVLSLGGGTIGPNDFEVTQTGDEPPPNVATVEPLDQFTFRVILDRIISFKEWTTIRAIVEDECGNPILDPCDCDADASDQDRIDIGRLPGDINQDGIVTPQDMIVLRSFLWSGASEMPCADELYFDIDRDGALRTPRDFLHFRQMMAGTPPATRSWILEQMNNPRP